VYLPPEVTVPKTLVYSFQVSLDGFVESPGKKLDWILVDEEVHSFYNQQTRETDLSLYGRGLYELMASYWPTADASPSALPVEVEFARIWRQMPKVVFSTTLQTVDWNSRLVRSDLAAEIARLKEEPGEFMDIGGPTLAASAIQLGLVDEYRLMVQPVVLGSGTPFLPRLEKRFDLELVETQRFGSGVVYLRYRVARR
jgi:dihydrofolate reductase